METEFQWNQLLVRELLYRALAQQIKTGESGFSIVGDDIATSSGVKIIESFKELKKEEKKKKCTDLILSFKDQFGYIYTKNKNNGKFVFDNNDLDSMLKSENHKIWSVQNGNDVLTVGDKVKVISSGESYFIREIKLFENQIALKFGNIYGHVIPSTNIVKVEEETKISIPELRTKFEQFLKTIE